MTSGFDRMRIGLWLLLTVASLAVAWSYFISFFHGAPLVLAAYLCTALPALALVVPRLAAAPARRRWAVAAASLLAGTAIVAMLGFARTMLSSPASTFLTILLATLVSGWLATIAARVALPRLTAGTIGGALGRIAGALALGALLAQTLAPLPVLPTFHRLEVVATGERNPEAQGEEVWFFGVFGAHGGPRVDGRVSHDGRWTQHDDALVVGGPQAASLVWQGWLVGDAEVRLLSHPWSGKARVLWDGAGRDIDLFSREGRQATVALPVDRGAASRAYGILFRAATSVTLALIILIVGFWVAARSPVAGGAGGDPRRARVATALAYATVVSVVVVTRVPFFLERPIAGAFPDSGGYVMVARSIAGGVLPRLEIRPPGYPLFILLARLVSPTSVTLVLMQSLVTLGAAMLLVYAFRRLGPWSAVAAAVGYSALLASDQFLVFETCILSDSLYANLVVVSAALLVLAVTSRDWRYFGLQSVAVGAAILVRPAGLFLVVVSIVAGLYAVWSRWSWRCALAAVAPWLVMINGLCVYNYLKMGSYLVSAWGTANFVAATGTFWVPRPEYPETLRRQVQAFTATIAPEDAGVLTTSWDPEVLFPIYTRYYNAAFFGDPGAVGFLREQMAADHLTPNEDAYLEYRPQLAALVRHSITGRPLDYVRFVWTMSYVALFSDQSSDFVKELDSRTQARRTGGLGPGGTVPFDGWFSDWARVVPEATSPTGAADSSLIGVHGTLREWLPSGLLLGHRAFWIAGLFATGAILLTVRDGRRTLGFVAWSLSLYWLGTMLTVALVELTIPRYLFPAYFVIYLVPAVAVALLVPGDSAGA